MTVALSTGEKNAILDGVFNSGSGSNFDSGTLTIRTGAAPGPSVAPTGTVVATITLPADAYAAAASGAIAKSGTWQDTSADASGTAAHFRLVASGDGGGISTTDKRIEGTVTVSGGGGDLTVDSVSFTSGQSFTITAFSWAI